MRKFFKKSFLCLGIMLCGAYNATATTVVIASASLSNLGASPYVLQFNSSSTPTTLRVDMSGRIIKSIDLNAASATSIVINQSIDLLLGSLYDRQTGVGGGVQTIIALRDHSTLTLTGDNAWATSGHSTNLLSNSFYHDGSQDFLLIDNSGQAITTANPSALQAYLQIQLYAGGMPSSVTSYTGSYNLYSGVSSVTLGVGATLTVDTARSSSGNNDIFGSGGSTDSNSPTILTNSFDFADSSAILTINTPLIVTHPSIGNFGHITANINIMGGAASPSLVINAGSQHTTIYSIWDNNVAPVFVLSGTTIADPSIASSTIYIGTDTAFYDSSTSLAIIPSGTWTTIGYNNSTSNFTSNGLYISHMYPLGNSTLILDSSGATPSHSVHFFSPDTGIGGRSSTSSGTTLDLAGNVALQTRNGNPLTLDAGSETSGSLGSYGDDNNSHTIIARLSLLGIYGAEQVDVIMPVYSRSILFDSSGSIHLVQPGWVSQNSIPASTMGDGATITLLQDLVPGSSITTSGGDSNLTSTEATINLNKFTFNTGETAISTGDNTTQNFTSSLKFMGSVTINTSFEANSQLTGGRGGRFVLANGGSLDLSGAAYTNGSTTLDIELTADGAVPANGEFSYPLFTTQSGGHVDLPQSSSVNFSYSITNPNPLIPMTWEYDPDTYIISSNTDRSQAVDIVQGSGGSGGAIAIINNLVNPQDGSASINTLQATALNNINAGNLDDTLNNLEQLVLSTEAEDAVASIVAMHESEAQASLLASTDSLMFTEEESIIGGEGIAAGDSIDDDIKHQQGIWVSGFAQKGKQKSGRSIPGYKVTSYGGTLGFDSGFTDNLILGLAWSRADATLKRTDLRGSGSRIKTNLFSIYGLMSMPQNWLIQSSISGGFSKIASRLVRGVGTNSTIATGKHNSDYFGADIHLLKRLSFNNSSIIAEPDLGLNMSQFNDKSYKESGGATNWGVGKRQSYNIEAIVGGRLLTSYKARGEWLLKPYIAAYGHITIKDKKGKIYTSLDSKMNGVYLAQSKASRAWYSGGAGLFLYKGSLEISTAWELQLDKGYMSNQGSFKIRAEF